MANDTSAMVAMGRHETRDLDVIHRRRLSDRVYATSPGKSQRVSIVLNFDLSHLAWQEKANCRDTDPEVFFPLPGETANKMVRAVCDACPVKQTCLEYAVERPQLQGIWGGVSDGEREKIRTERGIEGKAPARHAAP